MGVYVYEAGQAQDIVFVIREKPHEHFKRNGSDLIYTVPGVSFVDAITGFEVSIYYTHTHTHYVYIYIYI